MTIREFYNLLPKDGWSVESDGRIRRSTKIAGRQCPITAVAGIKDSTTPWVAAEGLGLTEQCADQIVAAADWRWSPRSIRKRLLAHLGLEEK